MHVGFVGSNTCKVMSLKHQALLYKNRYFRDLMINRLLGHEELNLFKHSFENSYLLNSISSNVLVPIVFLDSSNSLCNYNSSVFISCSS